MNIKIAVTNALIHEGQRLLPELERYEREFIVRRFMKYRGYMTDVDAFTVAFKDIPNLDQRSHAWAESRQ